MCSSDLKKSGEGKERKTEERWSSVIHDNSADSRGQGGKSLDEIELHYEKDNLIVELVESNYSDGRQKAGQELDDLVQSIDRRQEDAQSQLPPLQTLRSLPPRRKKDKKIALNESMTTSLDGSDMNDESRSGCEGGGCKVWGTTCCCSPEQRHVEIGRAHV